MPCPESGRAIFTKPAGGSLQTAPAAYGPLVQLDFPGVSISFSPECIILHSETVLNTLSSAVVGGGFTRTHVILNRHVDKQYDHPDPPAELRAFAVRMGITGPFVGLMTAAYLETARSMVLQRDGLRVGVLLTAGLSNATSAGLSPPVAMRPGTINQVLLVDANLSPAAMVNLVITATEAKTDTLRRLGVLTPAGEPATGTSTDAVVIACTGRGPVLPYAGPVTPVGWLVAQAVRQCLAACLSDDSR
ncbi:MAG: hypothetical protein D6784_00910 [Chloroflexi bacterium]|nr:MAG: hypothetical protein D6784_00910 [Chloroflexota bacterium]